MRRFSVRLAITGIAALAACSNGNEPGGGQGHPAGTIVASPAVPYRPYAVAITPGARVLVGQLDNAKVVSDVLPSSTFGQSFNVGTVPTDIAVNAAGTEAFVANQFDDAIQRLDASTGVSLGTIPVTGDPFSVLVANGASAIYVTTNADSVFRIDVASKAVTARRATDNSTAQSLALNPKTGALYVSTRAAGTVLELDPNDLSVARRFSPGGMTQEVAVTADGSELWIANQRGFVTVVTLATGQSNTIAVPGMVWGLAITPDQQQVWVGVLDAGVVKVIDRASRRVASSIPTGGIPRRIRFTAAGDRAVIANENGWVNIVK